MAGVCDATVPILTDAPGYRQQVACFPINEGQELSEHVPEPESEFELSEGILEMSMHGP